MRHSLFCTARRLASPLERACDTPYFAQRFCSLHQPLAAVATLPFESILIFSAKKVGEDCCVCNVKCYISFVAACAQLDVLQSQRAKNAPLEHFLDALSNPSSLFPRNKKGIHTDAFFVGGRGWIRTIEGNTNRFTVCPLWPLGNSPTYYFV